MKTPANRTLLLCALSLYGCAQIGEPIDTYSDDELRSAFVSWGIQGLSSTSDDSEELVELGRILFFDRELSGPRNISCGDCHSPVAGTGDGLPLGFGAGAIGIGPERRGAIDILTPRNTTPLYNLGHDEVRSMFWDARITPDDARGTFFAPAPELMAYDDQDPERAYRPEIIATLDGVLAAQALFPLVTPPEMQGFPGQSELGDTIGDAGATWDLIVERLLGEPGIDEYRRLFAEAFPETHPEDFNIGHVGVAIAAFQRTSFSATDTPLDRFLRDGEDHALSAEAKEGAIIFLGRGRCAECHNGPHLSDFDFHSVAVPQFGIGAFGRGDDTGVNAFRSLTGQPTPGNEDYAFRTPPLRNVALTGPYFHNGAFQTLEDVIRHHNDIEDSLRNYSVEQVPELFWGAYADVRSQNEARLAAAPSWLRRGLRLTDHEIEVLEVFLREALTDPNSVDQTHLIPSEVPSGLPVEQPN